MSFRTRLFLVLIFAVLLPLGALAYGLRREMERRLTREYEERVAAMVAVIETDLSRESAAIASRLSALSQDLSQDNRFRLGALQSDPGARTYLLDYAGQAMRLSGLALLQIQDSTGRILSSGHFRNQFDQSQPELPRFLAALSDSFALVRTRTPEGSLLALTRLDTVKIGGRKFSLVGGIEAEHRLIDRLGRDRDISVTLVYPGTNTSNTSSGIRVLRTLPLAYLDLLTGSAPTADTARLLVTQSPSTLEALRRSVDRWFLAALGLTLILALGLAAWFSSTVSRPLRELAGKTSSIDLDRLDQSFATDRSDEIGILSRLLGAMTERLRLSTARLREAERRAAVGDLARQVNHDIRNGLAPIRNVVRHFAQVARQDPGQLPGVFEARKATLESSIEYLDTLAQNYDRLSPGMDRQSCDVNAIVQQVLRNISSDGTELRSTLAERLPMVVGDTLMIRRILENLVGNAVDSLAGKKGSVTVSTEALSSSGEAKQVRITVSDTGPGMSRQELDRAFDDFYTTKPGGTGLGLSIVRRLILDLSGSLRVETEPGTGTRVIVDLPSATAGERS